MRLNRKKITLHSNYEAHRATKQSVVFMVRTGGADPKGKRAGYADSFEARKGEYYANKRKR